MRVIKYCEARCDRKWFGLEVRCLLVEGHTGLHQFAARWSDDGIVENLTHRLSD